MQKVTLVLLACLSVSYGLHVNDQDFNSLLTRVAQLENENKELKGEMKTMRHRRLILGSGSANPVAFTAGISARYVDHLNPNDTIIFDNVITDVGSGYDNTTGTFTAPISGIYMFSCSLLDHMGRPDDGSGVMLHADIVKNTQVLARIFAHAEDLYRDQGSQTVTVQVKKGDKIWVRIWNSHDLKMGGEMYSTFSGILLYPMEYA